MKKFKATLGFSVLCLTTWFFVLTLAGSQTALKVWEMLFKIFE